MAKPGPRPTPTQVLRLRGSWRSKRNPGEPQPEAARPEAPPWLSDGAKQVFDDYAERLHAAGVLTAVDELALARYADLCVQYRRASDFVAKHGDIYVVRGRRGPQGEEGLPTGFKTYPQAKRILQLAPLILQLERELGLTPAARAGLWVREHYADEPNLADYYFGTGGTA
ncbi:MAG: P27 family phage terminase small subunit [Planctomycetia bacterium]